MGQKIRYEEEAKVIGLVITFKQHDVTWTKGGHNGTKVLICVLKVSESQLHRNTSFRQLDVFDVIQVIQTLSDPLGVVGHQDVEGIIFFGLTTPVCKSRRAEGHRTLHCPAQEKEIKLQ